jgi:hypothetical protein
MPVRNFAKGCWESNPRPYRVSIWDHPKIPRRVRARNERTMTECRSCHRVVCPLLHDEMVCAKMRGVDLPFGGR